MVGVGVGGTSPAKPKNLWAGILLEKCNYMKGGAEIAVWLSQSRKSLTRIPQMSELRE
jgi:hypothetical protein